MKLRLVILCLLCFVLTASAFAFDYDFADAKNASGTDAKGWKVNSGTWAMANGMYDETQLGGANDGNAFRTIYQSSWVITDGTVILKVKHDVKSTGANDALLLFRMVDSDNGYAARLQRDNYITIGKIVKGVYSHLKYTATPVDADKVYTITIKLKGTALDAYVDDKLLVSTTDATFDKGQIGLGISRSAFPIHFIFLSVNGDGIPSGTTAVESHNKLATSWGDLKK
jgi:hypothetical protein